MKELNILLDYYDADLGSQRGLGRLSLPVRVLDVEGSILAEGIAGIDQPALLNVSDDVDLAFVRLTWPSGRTQTQRVDLTSESRIGLTFTDKDFVSSTWSAWAVPRLNPKTPLAKPDDQLDLGLGRFDRVWLRLWKFTDGTWTQEKLEPQATYRNDAAWQLDLELGNSAWLLQMGGSKVPWRFVSLPGGGSARVLLTPNNSNDPRGDVLKVVVTSFRDDAETLLEFLARDAMRAADSLAQSAVLARELFSDKFSDPISAVAGAYYLLRRDDWQRIPLRWFENLSQEFKWLPDAAIIHSVRLLREGLSSWSHELEPLTLFQQCLEHGWPVYDEGISLLQEAASSMRYHPPFMTYIQKSHFDVQTLVAAKSWTGSAASFYGKEPKEPSPLQWVGMPSSPHRREIQNLVPDSSMMVAEPIEQYNLEVTAPLLDEVTSVTLAEAATSVSKSDDAEFLLGDIKRKLSSLPRPRRR